MKKYHLILGLVFGCFLFTACNTKKTDNSTTFTGKDGEVKLIVIDPGHFHAALLQKSPLNQVNESVYVYAPVGKELEQYVSTIESFNNREDNPTAWKLDIQQGEDFLEKAIEAKKGNVVVLAGNNRAKTNYISQAINAGLNVLSDKPMAINKEDFNLLVDAYKNAEKKGVLLYDLMTERYDILNIIEKELINNPELFGELQKGTQEEPAIFMESVHHFYKEVAGKPLIRPAWYYDVEQQGEGIADVTTHLIDLVNWKCFPEQEIDYANDIQMQDAKHWPTTISLKDFSHSTQSDIFPSYLEKYIVNSDLHVNANGTINYKIKGVNVLLKVVWNYQASENGGDTFTSIIKGSKASIVTVQDKQQHFVKQLYVTKGNDISDENFEKNLEKAINTIKIEYPFISLQKESDKTLVVIPMENRLEHEVHFGYVAKKYFNFLVNRNIPKWEITNTLAKYYITTSAVEMANQ